MFMVMFFMTIIHSFKQNAIVYSAAAVSDYFVPSCLQSEHKIQSRDGSLNLCLPQTPKLLYNIRHEWCPDAFLVSFKLETDSGILLKKAKAAITNYNVHCVIANELHSRHQQCIVVTSESEMKITKNTDGTELEVNLIPYIIQLHDKHIQLQPAHQHA